MGVSLQVRRHFKDDVGDEEQREGRLIHVAAHAQVFFQLVQPGIPDVDTASDQQLQ